MIHQPFDQKLNTIYLDMDRVLADYDKYVAEVVDKSIIEKGGDALYQELKKIPHLYLNLDTTPYAYRLWTLANALADNVELLTALPSSVVVEHARQDKIDWAKKHLGADVVVNFGPYSKDKWKHARPGDILIDDRADNIQSWIDKGNGVGIVHIPGDYERTAGLLCKAVGTQ